MTSTFRFGKSAARHDPRTLRAATYVDFAALPPPPPSLDLTAFTVADSGWPMFGNDRIGDCTIAAFAHMTELWTAESGKIAVPTEAAVESLYYTIGRTENPGQARPDNGLAMLDVCNYMRKHLLAGESIFAFAAIDLHNHDHVKQALALFSGVYLGFGIVQPAQTYSEFHASIPWTPQVGTPTAGHAVDVVGYDTSTVTVISWGRKQKGTWAWWDAMVDEAYAILPKTWAAKGKIPNGLNFATLQADLVALAK